MFGRSKKKEQATPPPTAAYTRYYEHDGMLRAYANRSMVLAMLFGLIALTSLGFAMYVRLQPVTVVHTDANGNARVIGGATQGGTPSPGILGLLSASAANQASPSDLEGRAVVRRFLETYLSYTPTTIEKQLADALNLMTYNLRQFTLNKLREEDTVGHVREDTITSRFRIQSIEPVEKQPWTYTAFGVKEVNRLQQGIERTDRIVGRYTIRLIEDRRSERNPAGLRIAEYKEEQMVGERDLGLQQRSSLLTR